MNTISHQSIPAVGPICDFYMNVKHLQKDSHYLMIFHISMCIYYDLWEDLLTFCLRRWYSRKILYHVESGLGSGGPQAGPFGILCRHGRVLAPEPAPLADAHVFKGRYGLQLGKLSGCFLGHVPGGLPEVRHLSGRYDSQGTVLDIIYFHYCG